MTRYSIEPRTRKYVKGYGFLSFARNLSNKYKKQLLDTELDPLKTASKKVVHKTVEFLGNEIVDAVNISYKAKIVKTKFVEERIIPPEKREDILIELRQLL